MKKVTAVDVSKFGFLIDRNLSVSPIERKEGPPVRLLSLIHI